MTLRRSWRRSLGCGSLLLLAACGVGAGEGDVVSDRVVLRDCAVSSFRLSPTFFAANPSGDQLQIRMQRGDLREEASDGLHVLVRGLSVIRGDDGGGGLLGQDLRVGLPVGVTPPGQPIVYDPDPPRVNMSLYLNDSCDEQNVVLHSIDGTIRFRSLFNGKITETNRDELLTEAEFDVVFADPRNLAPGERDGDKVSRVTGSFRFAFQRGQPAQPFP